MEKQDKIVIYSNKTLKKESDTMQNELREKILEELKKHEKKQNTIKQTGFISNQFYINSLIYKLDIDTLTIKAEKEDIYVCINLNQVYKVEITDNNIHMYLDNDTQICIKYKL